MTFRELDKQYETFLNDRDTGHALYTACLRFAEAVVSPTNPFRDEIAQDAAWKALERVNTIRPGIRFAFWFLAVVKNKQRDYWRRVTARERAESNDVHYGEPALTLGEQQYLRDISGEHREIIDLLLDGHSLQETATTMGISVRALKQVLSSLKVAVQNV